MNKLKESKKECCSLCKRLFVEGELSIWGEDKAEKLCRACQGHVNLLSSIMGKSKKQNKLTNEKIGKMVNAEGLGYAIECLINSNRIADEKLKKFWKQAEEAMNNINSILEDFIEEM